jgi:hypothetical protein
LLEAQKMNMEKKEKLKFLEWTKQKNKKVDGET